MELIYKLFKLNRKVTVESGKSIYIVLESGPKILENRGLCSIIVYRSGEDFRVDAPIQAKYIIY